MAITAAAPPGTAPDPKGTPPRERAPVVLIPWDPDAPAHVERLRLQRVACGWKVEYVDAWRALQREGKMGLHWIVSDSPSPGACEEASASPAVRRGVSCDRYAVMTGLVFTSRNEIA